MVAERTARATDVRARLVPAAPFAVERRGMEHGDNGVPPDRARVAVEALERRGAVKRRAADAPTARTTRGRMSSS